MRGAAHTLDEALGDGDGIALKHQVKIVDRQIEQQIAHRAAD